MRQRENHLVARSEPTGVSFATVYDEHVDDVYRFVHRRCRDHSLSEDITQETFMAAVRNTDDPSTITIGWLITVAKNKLIDVLRREVRYTEKIRLVGADTADEIDVDLVERLRVEAALEQLRPDYRLVLTLHYLDGYTVPALAEQLDRTVKSVEGLITRARRDLRAALEESAAVDKREGAS